MKKLHRTLKLIDKNMTLVGIKYNVFNDMIMFMLLDACHDSTRIFSSLGAFCSFVYLGNDNETKGE